MVKSKMFLSEYNEEKWLNKLGAEGYLLKSKHYGSYEFEKTEGKYSYRIDYLGESPETEDSLSYLADKQVCAFKGNCAYIANDGGHDDASRSRQRSRYGKLCAFFGVLTLLFIGLFAYNLHYIEYFNSIEYVVPADPSVIPAVFSFVVGKNPASLFIIPVTIILAALLIITILYFREWYLWRRVNVTPAAVS